MQQLSLSLVSYLELGFNLAPTVRRVFNLDSAVGWVFKGRVKV